MIAVDGRIDKEKLSELLQSPEETHLEFKTILDFSDKQDELNFVKDAVSMANRPPGGYILVGVDDNGIPALPIGTIADRARFDGARLGDMIRKYIEAEVHVISQMHEIDGYEIILIYLPSHRDGLPVPMSKVGQFQNQSNKQVQVFREGDILVREGAKNTPIRHSHWSDLLSRRDQRLRQEARENIDSLIADLTTALRAGGGPGSSPIPLTVDMTDETFAESVASHLETDSDVRLRQFLPQVTALVSSTDDCQLALDKITIISAQALFFERRVIASKAIDSLFDAYSKLGYDNAIARLEIITRVYILGSLAVRLKEWEFIHDLVFRPYPRNGDGYIHSSWIRHGQVDASRTGLFPRNKGGMMISAARDLINRKPAMHPDIPDNAIPDPSDLAPDDQLLNSLSQFDILYCLIVAAEGQNSGGWYPASSAVNQERTNLAFEVVANDTAARTSLFPTASEHAVAEVIQQVHNAAKNESHRFGGYWGSLPSNAQRFIDTYLRENP